MLYIETINSLFYQLANFSYVQSSKAVFRHNLENYMNKFNHVTERRYNTVFKQILKRTLNFEYIY